MAMAPFNPSRGLFRPVTAGGGYNRLSAGDKRYGSGQTAPNRGPVSNMQGYAERDNKYRAYQQALENRIGRGL